VVAKIQGKPALNVMIGNLSNEIITLGDNLSQLKERFNAESSLIRFLALLSPTCPL